MLVVGAGPAGSGAALSLARRGIRVLVIDRARFPRDKVCGDGVAPRSVAVLQRWGMEDALRERGYRPIQRYRIFGSGGGELATDLVPRGPYPAHSYVVPRRELDHLLVTAAREAGAEVWEGVRALGPVEDGGTPTVAALDADGEKLRLQARFVIAADGSRGSFSRRVTPARYTEPSGVAIRLYMDGVRDVGALCFFLDRKLLPGYGWVFPGGADGRPANVGIGLEASALRAKKVGLRRLLAWFLGPHSLAWPYLSHARPVCEAAAFPMQLNFPRRRRRCGSTLFVGDAAGLISPLSGEGIAYALESGEEAAEAVALALASSRTRDLGRYESAIRRRFAGDYVGGYLLQRVLVHPAVNDAVVGLLRRDQGLARGGVGILTNTVSPGHLLRPDVWARILAPSRVARMINHG